MLVKHILYKEIAGKMSQLVVPMIESRSRRNSIEFEERSRKEEISNRSKISNKIAVIKLLNQVLS